MSEIGLVVGPDGVNVELEPSGLFVLFAVVESFELAGGREEDILIGGIDGVVFVEGEPSDFVVVDDVLPGMALHVAPRHCTVATDVDGQLLGHDASLHEARLGVLAPAFEQSGRLDQVAPHPLSHSVHQGMSVV